MAKLHQQDQQNLTFDEMMRFLDSEFQRFPEHRAGNAVRYELADVLKSAFAMFALKSPSLLDFKKQTIAEESNLRSIFRIEGAIPCDNQMRGALDPLDPSLLRPLFHAGFLRRPRSAGTYFSLSRSARSKSAAASANWPPPIRRLARSVSA
jgi:hypothetical protein